MELKTRIIAQLIITFCMAGIMSGFLTLLVMGPSIAWLQQWPLRIIVAWPLAFIVSLIVGPLAFKIAARLTAPRR